MPPSLNNIGADLVLKMQSYEIGHGRILSLTDLSALYIFLAQHASGYPNINTIDFIFHFVPISKIR